ncbi:MAG: fatty acyl-AMP ligase [Opitutaceae bacterium]|nr:fatty acyl-AMP ligase [Opitutaceae bacterium]
MPATHGSWPADVPASLPEALDRAATSDRGMSFLDTRGEMDVHLSYAEIRTRAQAIAGRLLGLGLERGDSVGIVALVHVDFVCAFFACQYAGLVAVPLPVVTGMGTARGYNQQLARVLTTSRARVALGPTTSLDHLRQAAQGLNLRAICTVADLSALAPTPRSGRPLGPGEISHIQFSSGSTAFPKGIAISQRALMANLLGIMYEGVRVVSTDRVVSWLPFYHDMGLIGNMLVPTVAAIDTDYLPTDAFVRRPFLWLRLISARRATLSFSPTFGYDLAARRGTGLPESGLDLSCWLVAGIGGDMVQKPVLDRFAQTFASAGFNPHAFLPSYGLAESTLGVSFSCPGEGITYDRVEPSSIERLGRQVIAVPDSAPEGRNIISCGRVLSGHVVEIRDEKNKLLPDRCIGAVYVKGPSLMDGYYHDEQATRESLTPDGWLDTGDMGYLSAGTLYITGRRKDMIIINARNIWPQDIEWHVEQSVPGLRTRDTAAFLHHDADGGERAVLLVQCRLTDPEQLRTLIKEVHAAVLRNVGVDCQVEVVPPKTLSFTTSGKLMRAQARQRWLELRKHSCNDHSARTKAIRPAVPSASALLPTPGIAAAAFFGEMGNPGGAGIS